MTLWRSFSPDAGLVILARHSFHSGRSDDRRAALEHLRRRWPRSPLTVVAYSLGGNIALKLDGELDGALPELKTVVAVCPAADHSGSSRKLSRRRNRLHEWRFVRQLIAEVRERHRRFPDLPEPPALSPSMSLLEFDDVYIAPVNGFGDALILRVGERAEQIAGLLNARTNLAALVPIFAST